MMAAWRWLVLLVVFAGACGRDVDEAIVDPAHEVGARRDLDELQRLVRTPRSCAEHADCPTGSHCDVEDDRCAWECISDTECGPGRGCSIYGSCVAQVTASLSSDSAGCQALPPAERRAAALALHTDAEDGWFVPCDSDETCPCGSYCSVDAICQVECLADAPPPELTCGAGLACTPLGRCAPAPTTPPPPLALTLSLSESATSRNTAQAAVVVPLTVAVSATSLGVVDTAAPAVVKLTIAEQRAFEQGRTSVAPAPVPRVRCAAGDPLATDCTIAGGWTFDIASGQLRSLPKQIWVEIPQTTTPQQWTLEARSEWAADPAQDVIRAEPRIIPATDPGRYRGTMFVGNHGAATPIGLPIDAIVTATHIALLEPTRIVFPDGHAVLSRDSTKTLLLAWLTDASARYDVRLDLMGVSYDASTGHLDADLEVVSGGHATELVLALDRTDEADSPACPCGAGSYCNAAMAWCLPGSGPPAGGGIVPSSTASASTTLATATFAAWSPPLATAAAGAPGLLAGSGTTGLERAYCFEQPAQLGGAARLGTSTQAIAGDLSCARGVLSEEYAQPTFEYANLSHEYGEGTGHGADFDLFEACVADLDAQPAGPATAGNLLAPRPCASLGRFLLAMNANAPGGVGQPLADTGQRVVHQVVRQWLGAHAYVASSAVQLRRYDDALSVSSLAAHERLGSAVDLVERGLRVLLDPRVRPQIATGAGLARALASPDYRTPLRPIARWTFNDPVDREKDAEGTNRLVLGGVALNDAHVFAHAPPATATCRTLYPVALADRAFTLAAQLGFTPANGTTTVLFDKQSSSGDRLWLEATTTDAGAHMNLALKDSRGGVATFAGVESGLVAVAVDGASYRVMRAPLGAPATESVATSVVNGGPRWGAAGIVKLACGLPTSTNSCTSWDRNTAGDGMDVAIQPQYVEPSATWRYLCRTTGSSTTCSGTAPTSTVCTTKAATRRTQLIQGLLPTPPSGAVNALTVTGVLVDVASGNSQTPTTSTEWTDYRCDFTIRNLPSPITGVKPVCGVVQPAIRWDEVSLWSRPVQRVELEAMSARYANTVTNETLPPKTTPAGKEQAAGLPVHILEAASADLDLLADYIEAARGAMYEECDLDTPSQAGADMLDRAGKNLRVVALLEHEAERLAIMPGVDTSAWFPRYQAAQRQLAGRRARAVRQLMLARECKNPLGIEEDDLPLYVGEEVGPSAKFFASSRFLTAKANEEIALAESKRASARTKYVEQRQAAYQLDQARESKVLREAKLRTDYESALMRYCGKPAGTQKLLDGFLAGTLTPSNCFLKTELPECQNLDSTSLANTPSTCLRGEIGARLIAIQSAHIDMENASRNHTRLIEQFDGDTLYCWRRRQDFNAAQEELVAHNAEMSELRAQAQGRSTLLSSLKGLATFGVGAAMSDPKLVLGGFLELAGSLAGIGLGNDDLQQEQDAYALSVMRRSQDMDIAECYHRVDNEKYGIDGARDVVLRVTHDVASAAFQLDNANNALIGLRDEAAGQLGIEAGIDATPPHLHFWLDEDITEYHRHLTYARRLTYLALRAFEYESQQRIGYRAETLTARRPAALLAVVTAIEQRNAPMQGEVGLVIGARPLVLSLRDEILRIPDLSAATHPLPGDPPLTPEQAFKRYLASESSRIVDANGRYLGRGIRFSLRPSSWSETSCAERIWRLTPSLQIDNPPTQHGLVLYQDNAFGSQDCRADFGTVISSRAEASRNLLVGDIAAFSQPSSSTAMNIDGPLGLDHETLRTREEGDLAGFAGRGLYGSYVLLFPQQTWTDAQVAKVKDLLLRFDIVEVTHAPPL